MSYPILNLLEIRVMLESVGDGGGAQRVRAEAVNVDPAMPAYLASTL